jgi:hypothetical protein
VEDAPALLDLYERHYGVHTGSLDRTLAHQRYLLCHRLLEHQENLAHHPLLERPPLVAVDTAGAVRGYLMFAYGPWWHDLGQAHEVAADTWPAALALLRRHAALVARLPEPRPALRWQAPPDSPTVHLLADHLPLRSVADVCPGEGWQARPVHLPALFGAILPTWQQRVPGVRAEGSETSIALAAEGARASLTPQVFVALLFGYRPPAWAVQQPAQDIPPAALPLLEALFPPQRPCIPGTDAF